MCGLWGEGEALSLLAHLARDLPALAKSYSPTWSEVYSSLFVSTKMRSAQPNRQKLPKLAFCLSERTLAACYFLQSNEFSSA